MTLLQPSLAELLKKKGIGPEGSKSLKEAELAATSMLLMDATISLTTKATLLTAMLMLEPTPAEKVWLDNIKISYKTMLPDTLWFLFETTSETEFQHIIKKVVEKNDLSSSLCRTGMEHLFNPKTEEYLKGPFLESERLKRESFSENESFLNFMWKKCSRTTSQLPLIIDIGDSYDGNTRTLHLSVFVAALLASAGFPCYVHGVEKVAPKEGVTAHGVLKKAGKNSFKTLKDASSDIENSEIGWSYIDQSIFFPELYELIQMRKEMVKRPFLATFEKILQPIRSKNGNHLVTGYTHLHYRTEVINQLVHQKQCNQAIVLRGAEGSTGMSMSRDTICIHYDGNTIHETLVNPEQFSVPEIEFVADKNALLNQSFSQGLAAMNGEKNFAFYSMIYQASAIVSNFGLSAFNSSHIFENCILSGKTLLHWNKGCV